MAVAALQLPITESPPGSYARFRQAIARSADDRSYRDIPVDWWDASSGVWRPTAVIRAEPRRRGSRTYAEVLTPEGVGTSVLAVRIDDLRLSELLTAGITRYWVARYRRLLLLALVERCELSDASLFALHSLHDQLLAVESHGRDVWVTAFRAGAPRSFHDAPLQPLDDDALRGHGVQGSNGLLDPNGIDEATLTDTAIPLLAQDLLRLHGALIEAGLRKHVAGVHPMVAAVATLFRAAVASAGHAKAVTPRDWVGSPR